MYLHEAREEYLRALRAGQKEYKECLAAGKNPYPIVLDEILPETETYQEIGTIEVPANRIVGTKSHGRTSAFSASFRPLLDVYSEFARKWISLCAAHLSDEGIRDSLLCYEYMGNFYVEEGNKRASVLRHFGSPRIPCTVRRILPAPSDDPQVKAYYEFLEFYKDTKLYDVLFRQPGSYRKLLTHLGKEPGEPWTESDRRSFRSHFHYFRDAFSSLDPARKQDMLPEEAMMLWLDVYPYEDLAQMTALELKKSLAGLWGDIVSAAQQTPPAVKTDDPSEAQKAPLLTRLTSPVHLRVAFIHQRDALTSAWTKGHEQGRVYVEEALKGKITARSYFHADSPAQAEVALTRAVEDGAQVVFTTTPQLSRATVRAAVKYPKVRFLNCSVNTPYSSIRTYYSRIFEGKFITGAIAGAMATNDRIGYIGSYPIYGVPASINAFALGAQLTNPRARVSLRWSCLPGSPVADFVRDGIRVISNRDVPTQEQMYLRFGDYGTYYVGDNGTLTAFASPCWIWGPFYERVLKAILDGTWDQPKDATQPLNYWWGMKSGVIDVELSEKLPESLRQLADILRQGLRQGTLDPFRRKIIAQDGTVKNDGGILTADELLRMDYLCENVDGYIPEYDECLPFSQATVRELGIRREHIPPVKEESL